GGAFALTNGQMTLGLSTPSGNEAVGGNGNNGGNGGTATGASATRGAGGAGGAAGTGQGGDDYALGSIVTLFLDTSTNNTTADGTPGANGS
ncbi:MAG TPA: hypothetical protein VH575_31445, partial [Gemmataceae bacterium]